MSAVAQRAKAEAIHLAAERMDCFVAGASRNYGNGSAMALMLLHRASDPLRHVCIADWPAKVGNLVRVAGADLAGLTGCDEIARQRGLSEFVHTK